MHCWSKEGRKEGGKKNERKTKKERNKDRKDNTTESREEEKVKKGRKQEKINMTEKQDKKNRWIIQQKTNQHWQHKKKHHQVNKYFIHSLFFHKINESIYVYNRLLPPCRRLAETRHQYTQTHPHAFPHIFAFRFVRGKDWASILTHQLLILIPNLLPISLEILQEDF